MSGGQGRGSQEGRCRKASLGYSFSKIVETGKRGIVMGDMNWFGSRLSKDRVVNVTHWERFHDAGLVADGGHAITYPAKEQNPWKPTHRFASRLDRVFYTKNGLKATKLELVNRRLETSSEVSDTYHYIS